MAQTFRCVADFLTFSTKQLFDFADAVKGNHWRTEVLLAGLGRCHDFKNIDMVKHRAKTAEVSKALYKQLGIFNMFCPYRPDGDYLLNLAVYEEKMVAKLLCELCRSEGWALMTGIKVAGATIEKMSNDTMRSLPDSGNFECTYQCPEEKIKLEMREKLG